MSGFRPELDLSTILPSYGTHLDPTKSPPPAEQDASGLKYISPVKLGAWSSEVWSTCADLAVPIVLKWDANGYYKALGVGVDATRAELREAYLKADGQESPWLTYCFKQLLNSQVRAAYDATPLGEPFLDEYTQAEIKLKAARRAMKETQAGRATTADEVMNEWGYKVQEAAEGTEPDVSPPPPRPSAQTFAYGYYVWKIKALMHSHRMADWQSALVSEAVKMGIKIEIAIGTTSLAEKGTLIERDPQGRPIIYLNESTKITDKLAKDALIKAVANNR